MWSGPGGGPVLSRNKVGLKQTIYLQYEILNWDDSLIDL